MSKESSAPSTARKFRNAGLHIELENGVKKLYDEEGTLIAQGGIVDRIEDLEDSVEALEDEIGSEEEAGTILYKIAQCLKLSGDQSFTGVKAAAVPVLAQYVSSGTLATDEWVKVFEMAPDANGVDVIIDVATFYSKGAVWHIRVYGTTATAATFATLYRATTQIGSGVGCVAYNSETDKIEIWTSLTAGFFNVRLSVDHTTKSLKAGFVATPGETPGSKPTVGDVYTWVVDNSA